MKKVNVENAVGMELCHDITAMRDGFKGAAFKRGDIITEFDGNKITEYTQLTDILKETDPGKKVKVKYYRSGKTQTATLTVGSDGNK